MTSHDKKATSHDKIKTVMSYTGSTAVLEAELDLEVLPEAGETFPGENGPIPAGR